VGFLKKRGYFNLVVVPFMMLSTNTCITQRPIVEAVSRRCIGRNAKRMV
jgi:hypothetical protein